MWNYSKEHTECDLRDQEHANAAPTLDHKSWNTPPQMSRDEQTDIELKKSLAASEV
jgi:hypothetical protein